jgi:hypothetical protein
MEVGWILDGRVTLLHAGHVFGPNVHPIITFFLLQYKYCMLLVEQFVVFSPEAFYEIMTTSSRAAHKFNVDP